jgi:hypothetical protein
MHYPLDRSTQSVPRPVSVAPVRAATRFIGSSPAKLLNQPITAVIIRMIENNGLTQY